MKKLIFIYSILFSLMAFAQNTINGFEYWFDNDIGGKVTHSSSPSPLLFVNNSVVTTGLVDGLHIINIRSWDSNNKFSSAITEFFYKRTFSSKTDKNIVAYEYWLDNESAVLNAVSFSPDLQLNVVLDFSEIQDGLHVFNIRFKDDTGRWSSITTDFFYKKSANSISDKKIIEYQFWSDNNFANAVTESVSSAEIFNLNKIIDYSSLVDGLHVFNIRFKDDAGRWSSITTDFFYKKSANSISDKKIIEYQFWPDNNFANAVTESVSSAEIFNLNKIIDYSSLVDGLHVFNMRFKDDAGRWSSITTDFFYKKSANSISDKKIIEYQFWPDNNFANAVTEVVSATEIFNLNKIINYSSLVDGLHVFNIRFKDDTGRWSSITTDFFLKKLGEITPKNIVGYEYWINDDYANVVKADVTATSDFTFNSIILPGTLTTRYNILNFRFKDDSGEWSSILSETFEEITLATVENTLKNVVFYPNPFDENLYINLGKNYHKIEVQVFDGSGRKIYQNEFSNKDLVELRLKLSSGVYQLILKADDKVTSKKILRR